MYDGDRPLADTAVLSAVEGSSSVCQFATLRSVDGKWTDRPHWVRVQPGTHSFSIECTTRVWMGAGTINSSRAQLAVTVADMKPRHIYVARYAQLAGNRIDVKIEDLGENSDYGLVLGNGKFVRPDF